MVRATRSRKSSRSDPPAIPAPIIPSRNTELVGLTVELVPQTNALLYAQYTVGLHAWLLDQVRQLDPDLSALLHDDQTEKAFTLSGLKGNLKPRGSGFQLQANQTYYWHITALSKPVVQWLRQWLKHLPPILDLRDAPLTIQQVAIALPPVSYAQLWQQAAEQSGTVTLSFVSPTSFRRKGHHFPLPVPYNLYHSYLRRWNLFSGIPVDADEFLDWVDDSVIVLRHRVESTKVVAGKRGAVTGFTGAIELGLTPRARQDGQLTQLFYALSNLAPYCGTGHKTTFGLGQTHLDWQIAELPATPTKDQLLSDRITELTDLFFQSRKRTGGDRALQIAETWATILARRELGESLQEIAVDLEIPYETAKTYSKRARKELQHD